MGHEGEGGGEKRSAVRWLTQRAAPADAACCASTCSALHFPHRNDTFPKSPRSFFPDITLRPPWKSSSRAFGGFFFPKDNPILHPPKSALHAFGGFFFSPSNPFCSFQRSPPQPSAIAFQKTRLRIRDRSEACFLVWNPVFKNRPWCGSWRQPSASPGRRTHGS